MSLKLNVTKSVLRVAVAAVLGGASVGAMACGAEAYLGEVCTFASDYCPDGFMRADGSEMSIQQNSALYAVLGTRFGGNGSTTFRLPDLRGRVVMGAGQYVGSIQTFIITVGQKVGQEAVVLTPVQIPAHTHPITIPPSALSGTVSLPLNSTAISGQTITGSVTVQALNGDSAPTGGVNVPTATANTVGKNGGALQFYPPGTNKVAVPTSHSLAVSGGTVSGTASGPIKLPETAAQLTTGANALSGAPVPLLQPSLGMTQCIVTKGLFPARP